MSSAAIECTESTTSLIDETDVSLPDVTVVDYSGISWYASVLIIVNAGLGGSLLAFPQAYHLAGGILVSLFFQTLFGFIALGSLIILSYLADKSGTGTYQEIVESCCGRRFYVTSSILIAIYTFGCSITFLIIIGDLWDKVFEYAVRDALHRHAWYFDRRFIISISSLIVILPLSMAKRIDFLRYASALGVSGVCYIGLLIVAEYFTDLPPRGSIKTQPDHWSDMFLVIPVICFGYQCHLTTVPVYACMRGRPNRKLFALTAGLAIFICYLSYTATGVFGYLSFGSHVSADVLVDYPPRPEVVTGLVLLAIKTYTTYPLLQFCGRSAIETTLVDHMEWSTDDWNRKEPLFRYISTTIWFGFSLLFALFVPNIGLVIGLLGGFAALFMTVFPGLSLLFFVLKENPDHLSVKSKLLLFTGFVYIVFGCFIFALTTTQAVMQFVHYFHDPKSVGRSGMVPLYSKIFGGLHLNEKRLTS